MAACAKRQQRGTPLFSWALVLSLQTVGEEGLSGVCISGLLSLYCQHYGQHILDYGQYINFLQVSGGEKGFFFHKYHPQSSKSNKTRGRRKLPGMPGCGVSWVFPRGIPTPALGAEPGWGSLPPSPAPCCSSGGDAAHRCRDPVFRPGFALGSTGYFRGVGNR